MLRRLLEDGRAAVDTNPVMSRTLGVLARVIVCIAGGTLGWALAHL